MRIEPAAAILLAFAAASLPAAEPGRAAAASAIDFWPAWRGPLGTGSSPRGDPPLEWSETRNVRWKVALPGAGHSTPIVWGERVFVTAAEPFGEALPPRWDDAPGAHDGVPVTRRHRFLVLALDRKDGRIVWRRTVREELPHEGGHHTGSYASASPATDGERIFAHFGSRGLHAFDLEGNPLWKVDFGLMRTKHAHGEASTPALHGDTLAVNWDQEGGSFVAALDKRTGKERWRTPRQEDTSWSSPIVVEHGGKAQLIVSGTERLRSYDLATGEAIWECGGLSQNVVASPVAGEGMVFAGSSYEKQAFVAVRLDGAKGDLSGTDRVAWTLSRRTPYVPSPLLHRGSLYFLRHYQGILTRLEARTGEEKGGPVRLDGLRDIYASPVAAGDRVYVIDLDGAAVVVSHAGEPRIVARNRLDEGTSASPAIAGGEIYLRGPRHLYCIARD